MIIERVLKWSLILGLLGIPFIYVYAGWQVCLSWALGVSWSWVNFYLISCLIPLIITPVHDKRKAPEFWGVILGFTVLFFAGYLIVRWAFYSPVGILAGFSIVYLVIFLQALGKVFFKEQ